MIGNFRVKSRDTSASIEQRTIIEVIAKLLARGGPPGNRTLNLRIKSPSLTVLSDPF